uniref:Peptidase S1 domain-containing protein n=1 Tax=Graphocephala atropunctata TaxID=36148 RepID=A0A1B6LMI6_9HEMI
MDLNMLAMRSIAFLTCLFLGYLITDNVLQADGANTASILEFPFYASIEVNGDFICGATVIDDLYVMSSNSCVSGYDVSSLQVRVGTDKMGHRGQVFMAIATFPYVNSGMTPGPPGPTNFSADIVLIKIAVSFTYDPHVMWLNPNNNGIEEGQEGVVTSWGSKVRNSPLVSASVVVLPSANCSAMYNGTKNISITEFCIMPKDSNSQPCLAELGSPLYYNEQYYGLVTYNPGCSSTNNYPVVVTEVAQFTSFIITILCDMAAFFP